MTCHTETICPGFERASIEKKFGKARRLWVFDRGIVSEDNLKLLRERGAHYLVGTPKHQLKSYEQQLLAGAWQKVSAEVQVQLIPESDEVYVLCRSNRRRESMPAKCPPSNPRRAWPSQARNKFVWPT